MIKQANLSHEDMELLSAYLDNALPEKEKAHFEFRLQESTELRQALEAHRQLQWNLRHLPKPKLPHNFTLTRAEAQAVKRQKAWIPVFSTASFVSFLLMAAMFILPLFSPAASPALQVQEPQNAASSPSPEDAFKAQEAPEAAPLAEAAPTELMPVPMAATSRSSETAVDIFFFGAQMKGGVGGGGGDASMMAGGGGGDASMMAGGGGGGLDAYLYPIAQGPGNLGNFGNAPYGIVVPAEPLFSVHPGTLRGQDYDLEQVLAATPSLPPLILGMNVENAGQVLAVEPTLPAPEPVTEAAPPEITEKSSVPAEIPQADLEPESAAARTATITPPQTRSAQPSTLSTILKVATGALGLLFAGLALYFKKR